MHTASKEMKTSMTRNKEIALDTINDIINEFSLNSYLTTDSENDEPFVIIEGWHELATIQRELNRAMSPKPFYKWYITYLNEYGHEAFQDMRFGKGENGKPVNVHNGRPLYEVPDGLHRLEHYVEWGFSDEYVLCSNCYKAICTTPADYRDIPAYAIVNDEILCHNCISDSCEEGYIESVTNDPRTALKTTIISEARLKELGWRKLKRTYENGMLQGMNDNPSRVYNKLKNKWDVLFTFGQSQFYIAFFAWIKKPASNDAGS